MAYEPLTLSQRASRMGALANYVMMFLATFTLGLLSPAALLIAYARRGGADPVTRSHYDHQIAEFWKDILLIIAGAVCGFLALAGGLGTLVGMGGLRLPWGVSFMQTGSMTLILAGIWVLLWLWGFLNLIIGSAFGFIRLASGLPAGKTRRS